MIAAWVFASSKNLGLREIPGPRTDPTIAGWLKRLKAWWSDDETPWCGVAVAAWMEEAGVEPPQAYYRAKAWLDWGISLAVPEYGCVVVFGREGGGHVGIVVGLSSDGRLIVRGGNQGNAVTDAPFDRARVLGYRWPHRHTNEIGMLKLPTIMAAGASSRDEA